MAIKINLVEKNFLDQKVDAAVFFVEQGFSISNFADIANKYCPNLERLMKDRSFTGKSKSSIVVPVSNSNFSYFVFVGLGQKVDKHIVFENYRRALGTLIRVMPQYSIKSVSMNLIGESVLGHKETYIIEQTAMHLLIADYIFDEFITERDKPLDIDLLFFINVSGNIKELQDSVNKGLLIGTCINDARHWVDLPSNLMTPMDLASNAHQIATDYGLKCTIFSEAEINKMGMGGLSAVSRGSEKDCKLVILEYKSEIKNASTLSIVGKGITFDSGGLSLKPAMHMETMKEDMSGAAAVIATMKALAQLKPKINIIMLAPISENMPSGTSVKPGDIVRFYNGKTAEIRNTDAEGRLILADALSYVVKHYNPDFIIDLATLTGACAYALGPFFSGLFSEHEELTQRVIAAGNKSGDYVWRLPLTDDYKPSVKCDVADLCNIAKKEYQAGATTAACFLQHFVDNVPWVHLDIAGTAFNVPEVSYYRRNSATGVGIRLLVELVMNWKS